MRFNLQPISLPKIYNFLHTSNFIIEEYLLTSWEHLIHIKILTLIRVAHMCSSLLRSARHLTVVLIGTKYNFSSCLVSVKIEINFSLLFKRITLTSMCVLIFILTHMARNKTKLH